LGPFEQLDVFWFRVFDFDEVHSLEGKEMVQNE
jgi:hypothetical protein